MNKLIDMEKAAALVGDGDGVAFGGNVLHRAPMAFVRELVKQGRRSLTVIKTAGAMDVDMLCLGGCVSTVHAGFVSFESAFGLADNYRKAVQSGQVRACEHACYTVICALRAAAAGLGFMPVAGLKTSDLMDKNSYFATVTDPFTGDRVAVVEALRPDFAVIHVHKADEAGNCEMRGAKYDDVQMALAAKQVIVTAEEIVPSDYFGGEQLADIAHFMVHAVVHAPAGAAPCSCAGLYDIDREKVLAYRAIQTRGQLLAQLV